MTSMPMLVAEELDVDWNTIKLEWAPADAEVRQPGLRRQQLTAGSNSVRGMWKVLRQSGATARAMLMTAAAQTWGVAESTVSTEKGEVVHRASGRRLKYGALVDKAAALPAPQSGRAQGSEGLQGARPVAAASGYSAEGQRHRRVRPRREASGHARRARGAMSGVRRQGRQLHRRQGQGDPRRAPRRADQHGHRGRRGQLLGRLEGGAGARSQVGRRSAREVEQRRHHEEICGAGAAAGQGRAQRRRHGGRAEGRGEVVRARLRGAVPGARDDGADELHRGRPRGSL